MSASPPLPARRSRIALRFSLRVLLVAFTTASVGFPIWYRWPYTEEELLYPDRNGQPDKTRAPFGRRVTSWQRQWGGGRLKHGTSTTFWNAYDQRAETPYRDGKMQGLASEYGAEGRLAWLGEFQDDALSWETIFAADGSIASKTTFLDRKLSSAEQHLPDGRVIRYQFSNGRLTHVDGQPVKSRLFNRLAQGTVDADTAKHLTRVASQEYGDTLRDVLELLGRENGIPMVVHDRAATTASRPDFFPNGIDLASAIVLTAQSAGCECDYRNGCIWVLPDIGEGNWPDPTGVSDIQPSEGTALAAAWRESVGGTGRQGPLDGRLEALAKKFGIAIDWAPIKQILDSPNRQSLDTDTGVMEFRHALTLMLFHSGCRCELRCETLVILTPE